MNTWVWIVIAIVAVAALALIVALSVRKRRTDNLRQRFGPEYERTLRDTDARRSAEAELRNRAKERDRLTITPLPEPTRLRYAEQWQELQQRFVDQPSTAVIQADELVRQVMGAEGYPVEDFNAQAALVSVDHPHVVENYRVAHGIYQRAQIQQATTEDMRTALISYRSLFDELLSAEGNQRADGMERGEGSASPQSHPRSPETENRYVDDRQRGENRDF